MGSPYFSPPAGGNTILADTAALLSRGMLALSPLGRQQRLSILIYHRVVRERDWLRPAEPTVAEFDWQMRLLRRHFTTLPLYEAVQMLKNGCLPPRAACVTFDDGYADNATEALPVLERHGIPATIFVATGYINGGRMWNDTIIEALREARQEDLDLSSVGLPVYPISTRALRRRAAYDIIGKGKYLALERRRDIAAQVAAKAGTLPDNLMLNSRQLSALRLQGVEIGGHTHSHEILAGLPLTQAREEIVRGKREIEKIIDGPLRLFAYPNGKPVTDYTEQHAALVENAGFEAAVTTCWGVSARYTDPFQLPRFTPWDKSPAKFLLRLALNSRHVPSPTGRAPCLFQ